MKCLVYITHKMDSDRYRYLSYLMKEIEGVMDLLKRITGRFRITGRLTFPSAVELNLL